MPELVRPASLLFNRVLRHTLGAWVAHRFGARYDADVIKELKPPYLVIGNHTCIWDPFLLSVPIPRPVHFVASDEYFRTPFMRFLFSLVGGIPITKNTRDSKTVRTLLLLKKKGAILGIYPEGNRNWDGVTGPVFASTAKLLKKLAIPVVLVTTTGGTLTQPRWGLHWRKGWMKLSYRLLFPPEACRDLSEQALLDQMIEALAHDDLAATAEVAREEGLSLRFTGPRLAERLELLLFQCPECGAADSLSSREDTLRCTLCGFSVRYGEDGRFHPADMPTREGESAGPLPFSTTKDWNHWQCANLSDCIRRGGRFPEAFIPADAATPQKTDGVLLSNEGALLHTGGKTGKLHEQGKGTLTLFANRLRFDADEPGTMPISLPLQELAGLNIQYNNRFECYREGTLFRFSFPIRACLSTSGTRRCFMPVCAERIREMPFLRANPANPSPTAER